MNLERQLHIFGYLIWSDFNTRLSCVIAFSKIYVKLLIHREYFKERKCGRMVFMHEWVFWHKNNECVRDRSLFIVWRERGGGGGRAGRRIFVSTTEHLREPPLKDTVWFYPPTLVVEDFMIPLLLSQPPQKASVTICKEVTSILILTFHEPWTATSHIWSSDMKWIVSEGLLFSSKSLKTKSLSLSSSSLWNSSSYSSSPDSPSLSSLAPHDSSVFTDSLKLFDVILCQASDQSVRVLSGRSQVLNFNFSKCESFLTTINDTLNPQQICYRSSTARK